MLKQNQIRYAVIGAGNIAQMAVLPAFKHAKNSLLSALISSDPDKRAELGKKYDIELTGDYPDLERILKSGAVDAVYVATPNALHKDHVLLAARCKVHVLCEKPLAASVADAEEMARACEQASVKLMVAYRLHFEEANLKAIDIVRSGKIGDPRVFDSVFSHVVRPGDIRERPEMGGGAMLDLGVYCVNAVRNLFREEPTLVFATAQMSNGVDDTTTALLQFPHGRVAQFTVSNSTAGVSSYRVSGTDGNLRVEPAYEYTDKLEHHLTVNEEASHESFGKRDQFAPELEYFSRCILEDREPEPNATEAICDLRVIEAILQSAATGKPVPLEPHTRARRPSPEQEDKKPAVSKQKPIHAPSPSVK
ncbi:MAG TPA: Gfo/Idh/MocA family oxidoreductase [Polyangiaceae bacterium]|nr:Gfo/Idh/MocA family oxidoreductase [Polyangiaceae bacterium]